MTALPVSYVNVFSSAGLKGNPVAVVHEATELDYDQMAALARWTNLSETTFLLPSSSQADYKLRIFMPGGELPFAGHPTLGSCFAWLSAGGVPKDSQTIVQECGVGLVSISKRDSLLEFAAPPLLKTGPIDNETLEKIAKALAIPLADIVQHQWIDNGPGWCAIKLSSAEQVLELEPNWPALAPLRLGVVGFYHDHSESAYEVRSFVGDSGFEDPVTGSLNAGLAQWLISSNQVEPPYVAAQGAKLHRQGRIHIRQANGNIWVGGHVVEVIRGEISI